MYPKDHELVWNLLWLATRWGMAFLELSVIVFLAQGAHRVSTGVALLRTAVISAIFATVDGLVKCILLFRAHWAIFIPLVRLCTPPPPCSAAPPPAELAPACGRLCTSIMRTSADTGRGGWHLAMQDPTESARRAQHKWGYWTGHAAAYTLMYGAIVALPYTAWRDALPARPSFYTYCACLCGLNCAVLLGSALLEGGVDAGYCVYGAAEFCYYAGFPPLLYATFLAGFFRDDDLQLESDMYSEMLDSGFIEETLLSGEQDDF